MGGTDGWMDGKIQGVSISEVWRVLGDAYKILLEYFVYWLEGGGRCYEILWKELLNRKHMSCSNDGVGAVSHARVVFFQL